MLEVLEDRLAPAIINWTNRASFTGFGTKTTLARGVIDEAILHWMTVIENFHYANIGQKGWAPSNSFSISFSVRDWQQVPGESETAAKGGPNRIDGAGKPYSGSIALDDDAAGKNWYFDDSAGDDFEFVGPITPYAASGGPAGVDLYDVVLHEMGHALGFADNPGVALPAHIVNNSYVFKDGSTALMDPDHVHTDATANPEDLMNPSIPPKERRVVSDLDARILADAYGYTISRDSIDARSFITTFNRATGKLTVNGDLGPDPSNYDDIRLDIVNGYVVTTVNGRTKKIAQEAVTSIVVNGGIANDDIRIERVNAGQPVTVNPGIGDNNHVFLSDIAHNLDTIQGKVTVLEIGGAIGGRTNLNVEDDNNVNPRSFSVDNNNVTFSGSTGQIVYYNGDDSRALYGLFLLGGSGGNSYRIAELFSPTKIRIVAGTGRDFVNDLANRGTLTVEGVAGADRVALGMTGSDLSLVRGFVNINNAGGLSDLIIDNSASIKATTGVRITDSSVEGLSPAPIGFDPSGIASLTVRAGTGTFSGFGNRFTVVNTPQNRAANLRTYLYTGGYADTVFVQRTSSTLSIDGQDGKDNVILGNASNMQGIFGLVFVANTSGATALTLDDSADPVRRNVSLGNFFTVNGSVFGLSPGSIIYRKSDLSSLIINGGGGGNVFNVYDTPQNALGTLATHLYTGAGAETVSVLATTGALQIEGRGGFDAVFVGNAGSVQGIHGIIDVSNRPSGAATALTINGSNDAASQNITIKSNIVTGLAPAAVRFVSDCLSALTVSAGTGGNVITVFGTPQRPGATVPVVINAGKGADTVGIWGASSLLTVNGQSGADTVTVGTAATLQHILASLYITNYGAWSVLNIDDSADTLSRTVTMSVVNNYGAISGFGPAVIHYRKRDIRSVNVRGGSGGNTFDIQDTSLSTFAGGTLTTVHTGTGSSTVSVLRTSGALAVDAQSADTGVVVGGHSGDAGNLNGIVGDVRVRGTVRYISIIDGVNTAPFTYAMDSHRFYRTDATGVSTGSIYYDSLSLSHLGVTLANGGNRLSVDGSPATSSANIYTGTGDDAVYVRGSGGDLDIVLGPGVHQSAAIGDATHSLDSIRGTVNVLGFGTIDAVVSNEASTQAQVTSIYVLSGISGQKVTRQQLNGDHYDLLNTLTFGYLGQGSLTYHAGGGGDTTFLYGTPKNTTTSLIGGTGFDVFWVETDDRGGACLGPVNVYGDPSVGEYAYYYDYLNSAPQTYNVSNTSNPGGPDTEVVQRSGAALVTYYNIQQIIFYTALLGNNIVNVDSLPQRMFLNMLNGTGDVVTVGREAVPGQGRTLDQIRGILSVRGAGPIRVVLDDSGDLAGKDATLHPAGDTSGNYLTGLMPGEFLWNDDATQDLTILGGKGDDTFRMGGVAFASPIHVDGGLGVNTLDYAGAAAPTGVRVNLVLGTGSGLASVAHIQNVVGSAFNDILVGNGGNVLTGGGGRDVLIAGGAVSTINGGDGEDLLIGGTTVYDHDAAGLEAIMAEWGRTDLSYELRVRDLDTGLLASGKVATNGGGNGLYGQADRDFFFGVLGVDATDMDATEAWA
jgi:hypothetical protein